MIVGSEDASRQYIASLSNESVLEKLDHLAAALRLENDRQNLVSRNTLDHIWQRHFADSAQLLEHVRPDAGSWLDLGAGAGFPGLVIALLRPEFGVILVESRKRRVDWLNSQIAELSLPNCRVLGSRLQQVETVPVGVISARAFAPLELLIALASRFSTTDTDWVLPKGRSAAQEVSELPEGIRSMFHVEQSLTDPDSGIVVGRGSPAVVA